jgi:4-amino-4-deoxy-L-arabinose transferase-like glycosyltransferase
MSSRGRLVLWSLIALGVVARTIVAFKTYGFLYDMDSLVAVRKALGGDALHVYSTVNGHPYNRWPYDSGFFPLILLSGAVASVTGLAYHGLVQLAPIAADGAIAWIVQDHLGRHGASERLRLAAAALVALGPSFAIISGFHGQIDSVALLPAVLALWLWERSPPGVRRALVAGALIGVGASIKTVPGLMLFALLPSVRSRREAAALVLPALAVPAIAVAPFLIADPHSTIEASGCRR